MNILANEGKLVRDKIPEIIRRRGQEPQVRIAEDHERYGLGVRKLGEEVSEYLASENPLELVDVLEVVDMLRAEAGIRRDAIEAFLARSCAS